MQEDNYALLSVYNKKGIVEFAEQLVGLGYAILSSGGTAKVLAEAGIPVTDVEELTGVPPILSHRVVTLHPVVHGGLLARNTPEHDAERAKHGIPWIELICVDLYPLERTIESDASDEDVIEMIDIGGPSMIMSGAKGGRIVVCDPKDRQPTIDWLCNGGRGDSYLKQLRAKAFATVRDYRKLSGDYFELR